MKKVTPLTQRLAPFGQLCVRRRRAWCHLVAPSNACAQPRLSSPSRRNERCAFCCPERSAALAVSAYARRTFSGLIVYGTYALCNDQRSTAADGWGYCFTNTTEGSVVGQRHHIGLLETARPGRNVLYVDDLQVPFELEFLR